MIWTQFRLITQWQQRKHTPRGTVGASQSADAGMMPYITWACVGCFGEQSKEGMLCSALDAARKQGISINPV